APTGIAVPRASSISTPEKAITRPSLNPMRISVGLLVKTAFGFGLAFFGNGCAFAAAPANAVATTASASLKGRLIEFSYSTLRRGKKDMGGGGGGVGGLDCRGQGVDAAHRAKPELEVLDDGDVVDITERERAHVEHLSGERAGRLEQLVLLRVLGAAEQRAAVP